MESTKLAASATRAKGAPKALASNPARPGPPTRVAESAACERVLASRSSARSGTRLRR